MATLFRKRITRHLVGGRRVSAAEAAKLRAEGKPVEKRVELSRKWYIRYRLPDGRLREVAGYSDKMATQALAIRLQRDAAREAAGLVNPADRHLGDAVDTHLGEYQADLEARGRTPKHVRLTLARIRTVLAQSGCRRLGDMTASRVRDALAELRRQGRATETINHHLAAV